MRKLEAELYSKEGTKAYSEAYQKLTRRPAEFKKIPSSINKIIDNMTDACGRPVGKAGITRNFQRNRHAIGRPAEFEKMPVPISVKNNKQTCEPVNELEKAGTKANIAANRQRTGYQIEYVTMPIPINNNIDNIATEASSTEATSAGRLAQMRELEAELYSKVGIDVYSGVYWMFTKQPIEYERMPRPINNKQYNDIQSNNVTARQASLSFSKTKPLQACVK